MKKIFILVSLLTTIAVTGEEDPWNAADWITCDRPVDTPVLAPAEHMGEWISGSEKAVVIGYLINVELPDKPIVRAMSWWGVRPAANAVPVINGDMRFFENLVRSPKNELDLAFLLKPGANTIELRFEKAAPSPAVSFGILVQFADGSEQVIKTNSKWEARSSDGKSFPVTSRGAYSDSGFESAVTYRHQRIAPAWFRTSVKIGTGLKKATLKQCSLGYGDPFINGEPVSDRVLSPPQTDYEALAMYETDDVTALLKEGENALSILLASGWFHQIGGFSSSFTYGRPRLRAVLELEYENGRKENVISDPSTWQWKEGEIVESNIYNGDIIDYRRAHAEWAEAGAGEGWKNASLSASPTKKLIPVDFQPIRRVREIEPKEITEVAEGTWLVDFGENISGWLKLNIDEKAGKEILIRYTEMARDGKLWNVPESHWWCHAEPQRDLIIAGGKPVLHEGRFSYKGFRYVEISGLSKAPDPETLRAVFVHNDCKEIAEFDSSDPLLNRIWRMGIQSHFGNMHSILEDCPHREKCQWGGDLHGSWAVGFHALDSAEFYRQQVRLYYTGPKAEGNIPGLVGVGKRLATVQMDFNWGVSPLFLSWRLWTQFGDLETAREFHPQMRHYLEYFSDKDPSGFPNLHRHADHAAPEDEIPRFPQDKALISAINYFAAAERFAQMSDALGKPQHAEWARALAAKVRKAILTKFDSEKNTFGNGTHDSLALAMRVFRDEPETEKLIAKAMAGYYQENGHKFDGGFMSYWIYPMLSRFGYTEDAFKMLRNDDYPGVAWSINKWDATSFWERFYTDDTLQFERSLNHHATNHPAAWLLTDLAGIRVDTENPGGKNIIFSPHFPDDLGHASGSMIVKNAGKVSSSWQRINGGIEWKIEVPEGIETKVIVLDHNAESGDTSHNSLSRNSQLRPPAEINFIQIQRPTFGASLTPCGR